MLVAAYGNDYHIANIWQFNLSNAQSYPVPDGTPAFTDVTGAVAKKFYKLTGLDLQYSSAPNGWVTLRRFEWIERNKFAFPNTTTNWSGFTNLRYTLHGNAIYVIPVPSSGQLVQAHYVPAPTNLQFRLPGWFVSGSNVVGSMSDTTGLLSGMNITANFTQGVIPSGTTISTVSTTTVTMSNSALSNQNAFIFSAWSDATLIEGLSGWDQFIIVDAARKAMSKTEFDASDMKQERDQMILDIQSMAEARDAGQAFHVSDVLGANAYGGDDEGGGCGGMGGGW